MSSDDMECKETKSAIAVYFTPYFDLPMLELSCHIVDAATRNLSLSSSVSERISRFTYLQRKNVIFNVTGHCVGQKNTNPPKISCASSINTAHS